MEQTVYLRLCRKFSGDEYPQSPESRLRVQGRVPPPGMLEAQCASAPRRMRLRSLRGRSLRLERSNRLRFAASTGVSAGQTPYKTKLPPRVKMDENETSEAGLEVWGQASLWGAALPRHNTRRNRLRDPASQTRRFLSAFVIMPSEPSVKHFAKEFAGRPDGINLLVLGGVLRHPSLQLLQARLQLLAVSLCAT